MTIETADAAFAADNQGRVVFWNQAAERLFGQRADDVLGRPCHEVLGGVDVFGNSVCQAECALRHMAAQGQPVHHCELEVPRSSGRRIRVDLSVLTLSVPRGGEWWMIHVLHPLVPLEEVADYLGHLLIEDGGGRTRPAGVRPGAPPGIASLTPREAAVLRGLASGASTQEIAHTLAIRVATVRTHVQNILHKLAVRSRTGAVAIALRERLL